MQYDLWKNVISRLEVRWDHSAATALDMFGGSTRWRTRPEERQMLAANIIYKF